VLAPCTAMCSPVSTPISATRWSSDCSPNLATKRPAVCQRVTFLLLEHPSTDRPSGDPRWKASLTSSSLPLRLPPCFSQSHSAIPRKSASDQSQEPRQWRGFFVIVHPYPFNSPPAFQEVIHGDAKNQATPPFSRVNSMIKVESVNQLFPACSALPAKTRIAVCSNRGQLMAEEVCVVDVNA